MEGIGHRFGVHQRHLGTQSMAVGSQATIAGDAKLNAAQRLGCSKAAPAFCGCHRVTLGLPPASASPDEVTWSRVLLSYQLDAGDSSAGENFVFQTTAENSPRNFFCAIRAISCLLGRQLTFFFSVLHVGISLYARVYPKNFAFCILRIPKNDFVYQVCTPKEYSPQMYTRHQYFGGAETFPTRKFPLH